MFRRASLFCVVMLTDMLTDIMLVDIMLTDFMLTDIMPNAILLCCYAD